MVDFLAFNLSFIIFDSILSFVFLLLFFYYYGLKIKCSCSLLYNFSIITFSYMPILMGITLLPFELSKYFTNSETENEKENDIILLIQKGLYYFTFALSYLIIPVFMEYKKLKEQESDQIERNLTTEDSEFSLEREVENSTCGSLFLKALKNQVAYYVTLVAVILVIVIVSLSLIYHFNIKIDVPSYLRIFPSISNFYNLIWYGFTIGFGIIKIPISIFRKSNFLYQIREISAQLADEDGISLECKNYLMDQAERERNKVIEVNKSKPKQICRRIYYDTLAVFALILSICYLLVEAFSIWKIKFFDYKPPLQFLLNLINQEVANQAVLFLFIGFLSVVAGYSLTCMNVGSLCTPSTRSFLGKFIALLNYKFVPNGTESSTFGIWSSYFQSLVPTIAYHCQILSGFSESSLAQILGKFNENPDFTYYCDVGLFALLIVGCLIAVARFYATSDTLEIQKGYALFKTERNIEDDMIIDSLIVNDFELNENEIWTRNKNKRADQNANQNNDLNVPLNELGGFHEPTTENGVINLSEIVLGKIDN